MNQPTVVNKILTKKKLAIAIAALNALPHFSYAGEEWSEKAMLDEIIVTSQKRATNLQNVPLSVNVITGSKIDEQGIINFGDLAAYVPNLQINSADQITGVYIRGLGSAFNTGFEQTVGLYVDGIYYGRQRHYRGALLDLERVEVLRGPQAILFGKNTIAGAINVTSAAPTEAIESHIDVTYGSFDEVEVSGAFSGPVTDTLSARVALQSLKRSSYIDNTFESDGGEIDYQTLRTTALYTPSDKLDITAKFEVGSYDDVGSAMQLTEPGGFLTELLAADPSIEFNFDDNNSIAGLGNSKLSSDKEVYNVTFNYHMSDLTLTGITGYYEFDHKDHVDNDFSPVDKYFHDTDEDFSQFSQELRLTSPEGETFEYMAGIYYQSNELDSDQNISANIDANGPFKTANPIRLFEQKSETFSAFFMNTWNISDDVRLSTGLRYVKEEKDAEYQVTVLDNTGEIFTQADLDTLGLIVDIDNFNRTDLNYDDDSILPMLNIQYDLNDTIMMYASATKGQKSGGFNAEDISGFDERLVFDEENSNAYEIGYKSMLLDNSIRFNAAIFYTEFSDLQTSGVQGFNLVVGNAAEATSQGLELDARWKITPNWILGGSYAYLDATYDHYDDAPLKSGQTGIFQDLEGESLPYSPENQFNLNLAYTTKFDNSLLLAAQVDLNYTDDFLTQNDNDPIDSQDSFTKVNMRLALLNNLDSWEVALIGKNLTNQTTTNYSVDLPIGSTSGAHARNTELPRTAALQFKLKM